MTSKEICKEIEHELEKSAARVDDLNSKGIMTVSKRAYHEGYCAALSLLYHHIKLDEQFEQWFDDIEKGLQ